MDCVSFADRLAARLEPLFAPLPEGFHDSFRFTQTGRNLTHPVTTGLLAKLLWDFPGAAQVALDYRLNLGRRVKFQPDLALLDERFRAMAFVDYESPNSSDARIPTKDVDAFITWRRGANIEAPYVIVTTLPDRESEDWELRYTAVGYYNKAFRGRRAEVRQNPFRFWYGFYLDEFSRRDMADIALVNIDGKAVRRAYPI